MLTVKLSTPCGGGRPARPVGSVMAQRRRLISGRTTALLGGGLLLVAMFVGMVFLSNQVTGLRRSIADLEDGRDFLESRAAALHTDWNEATRPEVVCRRAEHELGLVRPDQPEVVLLLDESWGNERHRWQRFLEGLTGAETAHAAELTEPVIAPVGDGRE